MIANRSDAVESVALLQNECMRVVLAGSIHVVGYVLDAAQLNIIESIC